MFDFPNQDICFRYSYLFVRGANRYSYQRTAALAAVKSGKIPGQKPRRKNQAIRYHQKSVREIHWDVSLVCITAYPSTVCARLMGIKRTTTFAYRTKS